MISDQFPAIGSASIQSNLSVLEDQYCDCSSHRSSLMCSMISDQFPAVGSDSMKVIYQHWKISIVIAPI
jgi:hypothetical protein